MNEDLIKLQSIGLSPAESEVYLILIKLGAAKAGQIITLAKLSSSNVHEALEKLAKKGLINYILKNGIKEYSLAELKSLNQLIDNQKQEVATKEKDLKELLVNLENIQKIPDVNQNAEVYLGFNGIKSAFVKLFNQESKSDYTFFYKNDKHSEKINEFFSKMDKEEVYNQIKTRAIFSKEYEQLFKKRKNKIKAKFTNQSIPSSINIYGKRVLIISWSENPIAFLIESYEVSQMFGELFEEIWSKNN